MPEKLHPFQEPVEERYNSYNADGKVPNLLERDFQADKLFEKLGTDVVKFKVAGFKVYLAPVYDMDSKEKHRLGREPLSRHGTAAEAPAHHALGWSRSRTSTWCSTSANGGGRSSDTSVSDSP